MDECTDGWPGNIKATQEKQKKKTMKWKKEGMEEDKMKKVKGSKVNTAGEGKEEGEQQDGGVGSLLSLVVWAAGKWSIDSEEMRFSE